MWEPQGFSSFTAVKISTTELDFAKHNAQNDEIRKVQLPHLIHDRYLIVDEEVWLLGASVKDMGHGMCTIIRVDFSVETVLSLLK